MKKLVEIALIIVFAATAALALFFLTQQEEVEQPDDYVQQTQNATSSEAPSDKGYRSVQPEAQNVLLKYENNSLGFSFSYPAEYGELKTKKVLSVGASDEPQYTNYYFLDSKGEFSQLMIRVLGASYDSGTESVKSRMCSENASEQTCVKKINPEGSSYYEVWEPTIDGPILRYEFPLSEAQSLVTTDPDLIDTITIHK